MNTSPSPTPPKPPLDLSMFEGMTPGPWRSGNDSTLDERDVFAAHSGAYLADAKANMLVPPETAAVNARAIAALPDLLSELKAMRTVINEAFRDLESDNKSAAIGTLRPFLTKDSGK